MSESVDDTCTVAAVWQSLAFEQPEYARREKYSAILELLTGSAEDDVILKGNSAALRKDRLQDYDVELLVGALPRCPSVRRLDLSYNNLPPSAIAPLLEHLKGADCRLEVLDLSYNELGEEGVGELATALQFNSSVCSLLLHGCKLGHRGGIGVASMLQVNRSISTLGLANTDLDTDCIIAMATVLHGNRTLRSIDLSRPLLHSQLEESTIHISRMLKVNSTLCELHLSKHGISDSGAEWLSRNLKLNSALTSLSMKCNSLSSDGAGHFASLLRGNPPLVRLDLSFNRIEDQGLCSISDALAHANTTLTWLNVCSNNIGDVGLCSLAAALKHNRTLTHVYIWGNSIGEASCNAFRGLLDSSRLDAANTDVRPYVVDGTTYLARTDQQ